MVEYAANRAGLGALLAPQGPKNNEKGGVNGPKTALIPKKLTNLLNK